MLWVLQFPEMNKTLKNTPDWGLKWKAGGNGGLPFPQVPLYAIEGQRTWKEGREDRVFMRFFSFPAVAWVTRKGKEWWIYRREPRLRAGGGHLSSHRHARAGAGGQRMRGPRHARQRGPHARAHAPRGGQGGGRAALINPPQAPWLHASLSPKHLARLPTRPPLPSKALTPRENRAVDLCRNIRPFFSKENVPQLCKGGWQYISNSGLSF